MPDMSQTSQHDATAKGFTPSATMFSSLIAVVASRKDSFSLPRRKEDYTFDRSTLQNVRASGCAGTALPPVFFLLTSTPNRADRLPVLLGTMRAQSHPPSGVVLTIPRVFARFNESYRLPDAERWPELRVRRIAPRTLTLTLMPNPNPDPDPSPSPSPSPNQAHHAAPAVCKLGHALCSIRPAAASYWASGT